MKRILLTVAISTTISYSSFSQVSIDKSITLSGTTPGNARLTGIKDVSGSEDALSVAAFQKGSFLYGGTSGGSGTAYTVDLNPAIAGYSAGMVLYFKAHVQSGNGVTLDVNSKGPKTVFKNGNQPLATGDISNTQIACVIYDGTNFHLVSQIDPSATNELQTISGSGGNDIALSQSGGTITLQGSGATSISRSGNTFTISSTDNNSGGTVTGTGAATRVAFWDGTSSLNSNANLYWDNTNGRLGIGTTSPGQRLHVNGNTILHNGGTTYNNPGAAEVQIGYALASAGTVGEVARLALQPYGHTGGPYKFINRDDASYAYLDVRYGNGGSLLSLRNDGNFGLGATSPSVKLKVVGDVEAGQLRGTGWLTGTGTGPGAEVGVASGYAYYLGYNRTASAYIPARLVGSTIDLRHSDASSDLFVNTSGNVGIGTTSPEAKLHVSGKFNLDGVETIGWQGYALGNQSVSYSFTHDAESSFEITAVFNHYGYITSYGCARKALVANYSAGILSVVDMVNVTSGSGGSWSITRSGDRIYVTKNAGTYAGGGYYFITVTGSRNLVKQ